MSRRHRRLARRRVISERGVGSYGYIVHQGNLKIGYPKFRTGLPLSFYNKTDKNIEAEIPEKIRASERTSIDTKYSYTG